MGDVNTTVYKRKLTYIFHNPNSDKESADFLARVFVDTNRGKVEKAIKMALESSEEEKCG